MLLQVQAMMAVLLATMVYIIFFNVLDPIKQTGSVVIMNMYLLATAISTGAVVFALLVYVLIMLLFNMFPEEKSVEFMQKTKYMMGIVPINIGAGLLSMAGAAFLLTYASYIKGQISLIVPVFLGVGICFCMLALIVMSVILLWIMPTPPSSGQSFRSRATATVQPSGQSFCSRAMPTLQPSGQSFCGRTTPTPQPSGQSFRSNQVAPIIVCAADYGWGAEQRHKYPSESHTLSLKCLQMSLNAPMLTTLPGCTSWE